LEKKIRNKKIQSPSSLGLFCYSPLTPLRKRRGEIHRR